MKSREMKIACRPAICLVLCHYYLSAKALQDVVRRLLTSQLFDLRMLVVVHNGDYMELNLEGLNDVMGRVSQVTGSNMLLDFSAFYEGLAFLKEGEMDSGVLFMNDSLFTKLPSWWILRRLACDLDYSERLDVPCMVGFSADYRFFLQNNPWSGAQSYICSACFFANAKAIGLLRSLTERCMAAFPNNYSENNAEDVGLRLAELIGTKFHSYLKLVLLTPTGGVWRPALSIGHIPEMQIRKALCFYLEHRLSGAIQLADGGLIFINRGKHRLGFAVRLYFTLFLWKMRTWVRMRSPI
ncbi:hypothetical protein [Rhodoferax sp.]|uniref:hypothetical protein n=1 Tax=Rhodoferax sp. TaxID=50421 RepID=UPI0025F94A91|nr:hypothetical protein [Rhodoferax sp.]MCM2295585.1 hypothetical protein [Rhodoferax sp.]